MTRVAVLDDWQGVVEGSTDWSPLMAIADVVFFKEAFSDENAAAQGLSDFETVLTMRERTSLPGSLITRLPQLRMLGITGSRNASLDVAACTAQGVVVCNTVGSGKSEAATAELALGLLLSASRAIPAADANMRAGRFQGSASRHWSGGKDDWNHRSWTVGIPYGSLLQCSQHECACLEREFDCRQSSGIANDVGVERRIVIQLGRNQHSPGAVA
jgi:lactate dehydrogenase-like 2-hydroxyacid dehydrogenase